MLIAKDKMVTRMTASYEHVGQRHIHGLAEEMLAIHRVQKQVQFILQIIYGTQM